MLAAASCCSDLFQVIAMAKPRTWISRGVAIIGDNHQSYLALEIRNIEVDKSLPITPDLHRARKECDRPGAGHGERLTADWRLVRLVAALVDGTWIGASVQ
jgi:hypothetical protein